MPLAHKHVCSGRGLRLLMYFRLPWAFVPQTATPYICDLTRNIEHIPCTYPTPQHFRYPAGYPLRPPALVAPLAHRTLMRTSSGGSVWCSSSAKFYRFALLLQKSTGFCCTSGTCYSNINTLACPLSQQVAVGGGAFQREGTRFHYSLTLSKYDIPEKTPHERKVKSSKVYLDQNKHPTRFGLRLNHGFKCTNKQSEYKWN